MNEESRPARRLPNNSTARKSSGGVGGARAWRRVVARMDDDELIRVARGFNAVDRAVAGFRKNEAA
jgi:hypothetical protein